MEVGGEVDGAALHFKGQKLGANWMPNLNARNFSPPSTLIALIIYILYNLALFYFSSRGQIVFDQRLNPSYRVLLPARISNLYTAGRIESKIAQLVAHGVWSS